MNVYVLGVVLLIYGVSIAAAAFRGDSLHRRIRILEAKIKKMERAMGNSAKPGG